MIYTLTLNPSVDYHIWLPQLHVGEIHLAEKELRTAGGKGINVSFVLRQLGQESVALGLVGGMTGAFIRQQLAEQNIHTSFVEVPGETRINIKLKAARETEINGRSPAIPPEAVDSLWEKLDQLQPGDDLVLAGSVPRSLPADIYRQVMDRLRSRNVTFYLDTKGEALAHGLSGRPFLVKPNQDELGQLFHTRITTLDEAAPYARRLAAEGAQHVIVTLGGTGAVYADREQVVAARVPQGEVKNTVGSGDSVVAGFLYEWKRSKDTMRAFRFALAAGSATAFSEGFCTPEAIARLLPEIHLVEM